MTLRCDARQIRQIEHSWKNIREIRESAGRAAAVDAGQAHDERHVEGALEGAALTGRTARLACVPPVVAGAQVDVEVVAALGMFGDDVHPAARIGRAVGCVGALYDLDAVDHLRRDVVAAGDAVDEDIAMAEAADCKRIAAVGDGDAVGLGDRGVKRQRGDEIGRDHVGEKFGGDDVDGHRNLLERRVHRGAGDAGARRGAGEQALGARVLQPAVACRPLGNERDDGKIAPHAELLAVGGEGAAGGVGRGVELECRALHAGDRGGGERGVVA